MREYNDFNLNEILEFIASTDDINLLKEKLADLHEYELSKIITSLNDVDLQKIHSIFSEEEIGEILAYVDSEDAANIIEDLNNDQIASIINTMEPDDAIDIIQEFDDEKQEAIINLLDLEQKQDINELSHYDEDTAGAIMNSNFISIKSGNDVKQIMKEIVSKAPDVETITTSFVVDENGLLLGTLDLKKIIKTKSPAKVDDIMDTNYISVNVNDSLDHTISLVKKYDVYELPVLNEGILKGIISMDDALDTFYEETEDDYVKFAAVNETLETNEKLILSVKTRLPWLILLLFLNLIIAYVVSNFDYIFQIDALSILVVFQPIILGLAGNCGTQSLGVTISEISKNELNTKNKIFTHIIKETLLGLFTGLILALVSTIIVFIVFSNSNSSLQLIDVITTVAISISASIFIANLSGTIIPIIFYKIKIDPAAASGPLITTIIDILAVVIYYTLATILIYNLL